MWTNLTRTVAPIDDLVTLAEAKAQLRIFSNDDDALIRRLIGTATAMIEGPTGIGRALVKQTFRMSLQAFPRGPIRLGITPIQSIISITVDGETLDPETYGFDPDEKITAIYPSTCWPYIAPAPGKVKITFVAGYGEPEDVPEDLRHAALMLVGHWFENREAASESPLKDVPMGVESILSRYRFLTVG